MNGETRSKSIRTKYHSAKPENRANRKRVLRCFIYLPQHIQDHFEHFQRLFEDRNLPLEVPLSYLFSRVELAQRDVLYCGVVKLHHGQSDIARKIIRQHHITRESFGELFANVYGERLVAEVPKRLETAANIRDRALHGSEPSQPEMRNAIVDVLEYAKMLDDSVFRLAGFRPFGNLRGVLAGRNRLPGRTTTWLMKGFGFGKKEKV
jgi:hypothetical protein